MDTPYEMVTYFSVALVVVVIFQYIEKRLKNNRRLKRLEHRRASADRNSLLSSNVLKNKYLDQIQEQRDELIKLKQEDYSLGEFENWSVEEAKEELSRLKKLKKEKDSVENDTVRLLKELAKYNVHVTSQEDLQELNAKLKKENDSLKSILDECSSMTVGANQSEVFEENLKFLDDHKLELEFLRQAYNKILELKASNRFEQFLEKLQKDPKSYRVEMDDLKVKEIRLKRELEKVEQEYKNELVSLEEFKIEHVIETKINNKILDLLRDKSDHLRDEIQEVKQEIEQLLTK